MINYIIAIAAAAWVVFSIVAITYRCENLDGRMLIFVRLGFVFALPLLLMAFRELGKRARNRSQ